MRDETREKILEGKRLKNEFGRAFSRIDEKDIQEVESFSDEKLIDTMIGHLFYLEDWGVSTFENQLSALYILEIEERGLSKRADKRYRELKKIRKANEEDRRM
jgi:hypothetical protein